MYVASLPVQPQQVFIDGNFGDRKASRGELTGNLDWYWEANQLYLFSSTGDPDVVYNNPGVEAGQRQTCFDVGSADYVVIDGITVRHANRVGLYGWDPCSDVTVKNCIGEWCYVKVLAFEGTTLYENIIFEDNIARYCGGGGMGLAGPVRNAIFRRNQAYENGVYQKTEYNDYFIWTFGIAFWEPYGLQ